MNRYRFFSTRWTLLGVATLWLTCGLACQGSPEPDSGVVVTQVEHGAAADRAGLEVGDVVMSWSRGTEDKTVGGAIESPLQLLLVETEQSPYGPVTLALDRDRRRLQLTLESGEWEVESRPTLPPAEVARCREADSLMEDEEFTAAMAIWGDLATTAASAADQSLDAAWYFLQVGLASIGARDFDSASQALGSARGMVENTAGGAAALYDQEGQTLNEAGRHAEALAAHQEALNLRRELSPASPGVAWSLLRVGRTQYDLQDLAGKSSAEQAVEIFRSLPSGQLELARALNILANFVSVTGPLEQAEELYREALALRRSIAPDGRRIGNLLFNLGSIAHERGRLAEAEKLYRQGLAIYEQFDPESYNIALTLNNLGILAKNKADLAGARLHYDKALEIFRRLRPGGLGEAGMLNNLGNVATSLGDLSAAERYHRQALTLRQTLQPEGIDLASSLHNLGLILRQQSRYEEAATHLQRALEVKERLIPGTLVHSNTLLELAEIARETGELSQAATLHAEALAIRRRVAPQGSDVASSLFGLGHVADQQGLHDPAETYWRQAIDTLEKQRGRLRLPSDDSYRFVAPYQRYYHRFAELLCQTDRQTEAFDFLESSRARALRVMMQQKGDLTAADLPLELTAERYRLESSLDRAESRLARINPEAEAATTYRSQIAELKLEVDGLEARVRQAAPRLAEFSDPEPIQLEQVRQALDPGTLLLSYSVGDESTLLFVVRSADDPGPALAVHVLPITAKNLRRRVEILRALIARGSVEAEIEPALVAQGARLFSLLLGPATEDISEAERVLVVADGPLLTLPFGALVQSTQPLQFFAGWKPFAMSPSAAVFTQVKATRPPRTSGARLVAFGSPNAGGQAATAADSRWPTLPHARHEVESIAKLFRGRSEVFLGKGATEERAKAISLAGGYLHFATHAFSDRRLPLDSALVLSLPEDGNTDSQSGILYAWEIIAQMRINADLVTLSGCETALGGELAGEGLIGLARAFQYAGARSLLVSQWAVSDRSTAELMVRFYANLLAGMAKSDALQAAQRDLMAAPMRHDSGATIDARHPFHWAAFQLIGDWQ